MLTDPLVNSYPRIRLAGNRTWPQHHHATRSTTVGRQRPLSWQPVNLHQSTPPINPGPTLFYHKKKAQGLPWSKTPRTIKSTKPGSSPCHMARSNWWNSFQSVLRDWQLQSLIRNNLPYQFHKMITFSHSTHQEGIKYWSTGLTKMPK